jgi:hypothetical protein
MVLKLYSGKFIGNNWKVWKCGDGEGYRRSVILIVKIIKKYYIGSSRRGYPAYKQKRKAKWIGHTLRINCLLKHNTEEKTKGRRNGRGRR